MRKASKYDEEFTKQSIKLAKVKGMRLKYDEVDL